MDSYKALAFFVKIQDESVYIWPNSVFIPESSLEESWQIRLSNIRRLVALGIIGIFPGDCRPYAAGTRHILSGNIVCPGIWKIMYFFCVSGLLTTSGVVFKQFITELIPQIEYILFSIRNQLRF